MSSYEHDIGERARIGSRFISHVKSEIQKAFFAEKKATKITQQAIADRLGVNRSVTNRQIMGLENMTIRSVAELLWALGWEPYFEARKPDAKVKTNEFIVLKASDVHDSTEIDSGGTRTDKANILKKRIT